MKSPPEEEWRERANCKGHTRLFFPVLATDARGEVLLDAKGREVVDRYRTYENYRQAKRLCAACEVSLECERWAIVNLPFGLAAGRTARERRSLRKRLHLPDPTKEAP